MNKNEAFTHCFISLIALIFLAFSVLSIVKCEIETDKIRYKYLEEIKK